MSVDSGGPVINITGDRVALGPLHRGLLPHLARWYNDVRFSVLAGDAPLPLTPEDIEAEYERAVRADHRVDFAIYERTTLRPMGAANLRDIDDHHRSAEFGIGIGEPDCWGKGYGTETTFLALEYGFTTLGLHSIFLDPVAFNERAIRAYRRAGFREIGRRREAYRVGARFYDLVLMDCLAAEFTPNISVHP